MKRVIMMLEENKEEQSERIESDTNTNHSVSPRKRLGRRLSSLLSRNEATSSSLATGDVGPLKCGVRVRDIY